MPKTISRQAPSVEQLRTIVALNNPHLTDVFGDFNEPMPLTPAGIIRGRQELHDGQVHTTETLKAREDLGKGIATRLYLENRSRCQSHD